MSRRYLSRDLVQLTLTRDQVRALEALANAELGEQLRRAEREFDLAHDWFMRMSETARDLVLLRAGHLGVVGMYYDFGETTRGAIYGRKART